MAKIDTLVASLKNGDEQAFDEIYHLTVRSLYFAIYPIVKDHHLTEDLVQEAYMKMLQKIQTYQAKNFYAYLITIGRNLAINQYHQRKKMTFTDTESDLDILSDFAYESLMEIKIEKREVIQEVLSCLNQAERNVFLLYSLENLTHREIGVILDKPTGTVTWTYQQALKKIKSKLKEG